jgi:histidinol-phosphate/aromatic aminotransferase/cobyric acid decarboxylase-like protein
LPRLADVARYPDGGAFALKAALCRKFGVRPEQLIVGNGSNDILELATMAFLKPGDEAVYAQHAFAVYPLATLARGAQGIEVPARDLGFLKGNVNEIATDRHPCHHEKNQENPPWGRDFASADANLDIARRF